MINILIGIIGKLQRSVVSTLVWPSQKTLTLTKITLFVKFLNLSSSAVCNVCIGSNPFTAYSMPSVFGH